MRSPLTSRPTSDPRAILLILLAVVAACMSLAQRVKIGAPIKDFKVADELKGKTNLLRGDEAISQPDGVWLIKKMRLESFSENGKSSLIVEAPECYSDPSNKVAYSSGPLKAHTPDGRLDVEGVGFRWSQADNKLSISNQVRTVVLRPATTNTPASASNATNPPITILSDRLDFDPQERLAVFTGHVDASDSRMQLRCGLMTAHLAEEGKSGGVENILAEREVSLLSKQDGSHGTSNMAQYDGAAEQVTLTGNAHWVAGNRSGTAQTVVFGRRNRGLIADGGVIMQLPRDLAGKGSLLSLNQRPAEKKPAATNRFVVVRAAHLESETNHTVLSGGVSVQDDSENPPSMLTCTTLTLEGAASTNKIDRALADGDVVAIQGTRRISGPKATFASASEQIEFIGFTRWKWDERSGSAERLLFDQKQNSFNASINSMVTMPSGSFGGHGGTFMPILGETNRVTFDSNSVVVVRSDDFSAQTNHVQFKGHVKADLQSPGAPADTLQCGLLDLRFSGASNRLEKVSASEAITIESAATTTRLASKIHADDLEGTANAATGQMSEMILEGHVDAQRGDVHAKGERAVYTAGQDIVRLTGMPEAVTGEVQLTGATVLIWDLKQNRVTATGKWKAVMQKEILKSSRKPSQ